MALTAEQQGEIEAARTAEGRTRRPVVPALEAMRLPPRFPGRKRLYLVCRFGGYGDKHSSE